MQSQPNSPGPAYSDGGTPGKGGFGLFNSLKKALPTAHSPRAHSPASSLGGGSEAGTPPSRSKLGFPSFSNGQRKRDIIKKLEEDVGLLQLQLHQRDSELVQLQQQAAAEQAARVDAQERLNMQYFKSHLLADMLVAKLLDLEAAGVAALPAPASTGGAHAAPTDQQPAASQQQHHAGAAQQRQQQQPHMAVTGSAGMLAESSFN